MSPTTGGTSDEDEESYNAIVGGKTITTSLEDFRERRQFTVISLNARSINNKFQEIRDATHKINPSVLCIQETWGRNTQTDYSVRGYHAPVFKTRQSQSMNAGGGVAFWIRKDISFTTVNSPFIEKEIETLATRIPSMNLLIINVYRGFGNIDNHLQVLTTFIDDYTDKHRSTEILMVGDFNVDLSTSTDKSERLLEVMTDRGIIQLISEPTRETSSSSTIIDHVYLKSSKKVSTLVIMTDISDHYITATLFPGRSKRPEKLKITKRWFNDEAYEQIRLLLKSENWNKIQTLSTDEATNHLIRQITIYMDIICPVETKEMSSKPINNWMTQGIRISQKRANAMYVKFKKARDNTQFAAEYKTYKSILKRVINEARNSYYAEKIAKAGTASRQLWQIVNEVVDRKQTQHKMPDTFTVNGKTISSKKEIANEFNRYFASIGTDMASQLPTVDGYEEYLNLHPFSQFKLTEVTEEEVAKIMKNQKPKLSCGLDSINNKIVKICSEELAKPMSIIINKSIKTGYVPTAFKVARIIPLYKKNAPDQCGNYRPVSLLSALSKILEKVVCHQMMLFMKDNRLICDKQFGFREKNQTIHVIQYMMNYVSANATKNQPVISTFIDLSKAFDCLQYDKLFKKMQYLGFANHTINWFRSYLSNRTQITEIDGVRSTELNMQLGVPQGSILGPILFLIYVNDINNCSTEGDFIKFADDTTVLTTGETLHIAVSRMNTAMQNVELWFKRNKLNLNPSKTRYMVINHKTQETQLVKIGEEYLERVWKEGNEKSFKLVGIWVDEDLSWAEHIDKLGKKINSAIYGLSKSQRSLNATSKKLLYSGLIHSHLVYGLPIWGFAKKYRTKRLQTKQKQALRKVYNLKYRDHTHNYFANSKILKFDDLFQHTTISYIQSGLYHNSPNHIQKLWSMKEVGRPNLRGTHQFLNSDISPRQWINDLPPNGQARMWNTDKLDRRLKPSIFKHRHKKAILDRYTDEMEDK